MGKHKIHKIYALYKGDKYIAQGTLEELSEQLNIKKTSLMFYGSPAYQKRNKIGNNKVLIKIE